jgi:hypothetical protein
MVKVMLSIDVPMFGSVAVQEVEIGELEVGRNGFERGFQRLVAGHAQVMVVFGVEHSFHLGAAVHGIQQQALGGNAVGLHHGPEAAGRFAVRLRGRLELLFAGQVGIVDGASSLFQRQFCRAIVEHGPVCFLDDEAGLFRRADIVKAVLELLLVAGQRTGALEGLGRSLGMLDGGSQFRQLFFQSHEGRLACHPVLVGDVQRRGKAFDLVVVEECQAERDQVARAACDVQDIFRLELSRQGLQRVRHFGDEADADHSVAAASIVDAGVAGADLAVFHQLGDQYRQGARVCHQPLAEEAEGVVGRCVVADESALLVDHSATPGVLLLIQRHFIGAAVRLHGKQCFFGAGSQLTHLLPFAVNGCDERVDALDFSAVAEDGGSEGGEEAGVDGVHGWFFLGFA